MRTDTYVLPRRGDCTSSAEARSVTEVLKWKQGLTLRGVEWQNSGKCVLLIQDGPRYVSE